MKKVDSNITMILLLAVILIYFIVGKILNIPLSETIFMIGFILLFLIIIIIHGWKTLGAREILIFFLMAYIIALLYEYTEGLGFGQLLGIRFSYSDMLGPKFLNKTPYIIPLIWSLSLYCAFTMTNITFNRVRTNQNYQEEISRRWFLKIFGMGIIAGLIMISWDLINDPVMVEIGGWTWSKYGLYYGIPLLNFEGWIEISMVIFVIFSFYLYKMKRCQMYIGGEKQSSYTLFVVVVYLAILVVYAIYAVYANVTYVIPWAAITMGLVSVITVIQFYRFTSKKLNLQIGFI